MSEEYTLDSKPARVRQNQHMNKDVMQLVNNNIGIKVKQKKRKPYQTKVILYSEYPQDQLKAKQEKDSKANLNQNAVMWKNVPNYPLPKDLTKVMKLDKMNP